MVSFFILSLCFNPSESMAKSQAKKSKEHSSKMHKNSKTKTKSNSKKDKKSQSKNKSKSKRHRKSGGPDLKALTTGSPSTEFAETPANGVNSIETKSDL